jgi:hypothetical protein
LFQRRLVALLQKGVIRGAVVEPAGLHLVPGIR